MNIDDIIEKINENDLSFMPFFSDNYNILFRLLDSRGRLNDIDIQNSPIQNEFLLYCYENNKPKFYFWCETFLSDIEIYGEDISCIASTEDLASLFCESRNYHVETLENILNGDIDFGTWGFDFDIYDEVISELDIKNLTELKSMFIEKLAGKKIPSETELLEKISTKQNQDFVIINNENIDWIFQDSETVDYLLENELDDLRGELRSLYYNSYESALHSDYYEAIWDELNSYFISEKKEWVSVRQGYSWDKEGNRKEKFVDKVKLPLRNFETFIVDFLRTNVNYNEDLENQGSLINVLKELDCLSISFPDYPDNRTIEKNINDYFGDYIY